MARRKKEIEEKKNSIKEAFSKLNASKEVKKERKKRQTKAISSTIKDEVISKDKEGMETDLRTLKKVEQKYPEGCAFRKEPTIQGLVWAEKCLLCKKECKIEILPKSELVKCPDFVSIE